MFKGSKGFLLQILWMSVIAVLGLYLIATPPVLVLFLKWMLMFALMMGPIVYDQYQDLVKSEARDRAEVEKEKNEKANNQQNIPGSGVEAAPRMSECEAEELSPR